MVLNTVPQVNACVKCFYSHFINRLALQNTNSNCFAVINNGVMVPNLKSVVPTRFAHGKRHSALLECLALMSMSKAVKPHRYLIRIPQQTDSN